MNIQDKVIVVTGASQGLGAATALYLAERGARVAVTYRHNRPGAVALTKNARSKGLELRAYHITDLASDIQVERLFAKICKDFGRLDAVVANAGGAGYLAMEDLKNLDMAVWRDSLKDNLLATVTTAKYAIKALEQNKHGGKIVLVGSVLGLDGAGNPKITAYSASKAATHNFARTIAKVLAPKIIVNVVAPGRCWSRSYDTAPPEVIAEKFAPNKHGRPIEGKEIAQAVYMVLENDSIIGQVINVEAGFTLIKA